MAAFFVVLGLTGLVKGPGFGAALVLAPVAGFLLVARDRERLSRWAWAWGWLLALVLVAAWPALVVRRHPDVLELWSLLFGGRVTGERLGEPFWYYAVALLWTLLPWTPFAAVGLVRTWREARAPGALAQRFVLAWALLVPLLLSLPDGKHHHYLLHALPAWALLAARGLGPVHARALRLAPRLRTLPAGALLLGLPFAVGAALLARQAEEVPLLPWLVAPAFLVAGAATWRTATSPDPRRAAGATFAFVGAALVLAHAAPPGTHHEDARFLRRVAASEHEAPLALDMSMGTLRGFHCLFYLHGDALSLHNLSFLRSDRLAAPVALVLTRGGGRAELERYGEVEVVDRSARSGRSTDEESLLTLFRLRFAPDLERVPVDGVHVSPLQAMYIEEGPFLEPPRAHEAGGS